MSPTIFVPLVKYGTPSNAGRVSGISNTALQIELTPAREVQFAGAHERMQRKHDPRPRERALVVLDAAHQLGHTRQRECRPVRNPSRADEALKVILQGSP